MLVGGSCAYVVSQLNGFDGDPARKHLAPIPVSPSVCPYVRVMHAAANNFERQYDRVDPLAALTAGRTISQLQERWPVSQARLAQSLNVLEFAVVASEARFPERIRRRFDVVLTNIRAGRPSLLHAKGPLDLLSEGGTYYADGHYAFGDASDLIGDACAPVQLAADPAPAK